MTTYTFKTQNIFRNPIKSGLIIILLFIVSCSGVKKNSIQKEFIGPNEFVFIECIQKQEGEVIKGSMDLRGKRIDSPTYRLDSETKQLQIHRQDNLSIDSIKILLGEVRVLEGSAGTGVSSRLTNITQLPYSNNKLTITKVDQNGIDIIFDKQEVNLTEGKEWQTSQTRIDTIKIDKPTIVKMTTTYTIHYQGKLNKSSISGIPSTKNK